MRRLCGRRVLPIDPPAMIGATRHYLVGAMLDADWHPVGSGVKTWGISGAAGCGAEFFDSSEWHGVTLSFGAEDSG